MAHSGVIIALYPNPQRLRRLEAVARRLPNPTQTDDMHVTICYLGDKDALEPAKLPIMAALMMLADQPPVPTPLTLRIRGLVRMEGVDDGRNALAAGIVCPELHALRAVIVDALKAIGVQPDQTFPDYNPHLTLGYIDTYLPTPDVRVPLMSVDVGWLYLCWGDERIVIPMAGGVEVNGVDYKDVSGPMASPAHGPGGLFSNPALEGGKVRRRKGVVLKAEVATKPFVSTAQQRWAFANRMPFAKRWANETDFSNLPRKVRRKSVSARRRQLAELGFKAEGGDRPASGGGDRGYGARAGEVIRGNLVRGADGKFGSGGSAVAPAAEGDKPRGQFGTPMLPTRKPAKKPKGGKGKGKGAAKPKAPKETPEQREAKRLAEEKANREKVLSALDIPEDAAAALADLRAGKAVEDDGGLVKLGLAEQAKDGSYRLTPAGRKFYDQAGKGDQGEARDTLSRAKDSVTEDAPADTPADKPASDMAGALRRRLAGQSRPAGSLSGVEGGIGRQSRPSGALSGAGAGIGRRDRQTGPAGALAGALGQQGKPGEKPKKGGGGGGGGGKDDKQSAGAAALRRRINQAGASQGPSSSGAGGGGRSGGANLATPASDAARRAEQQQTAAGARQQAQAERQQQRQGQRSAERAAQLAERRQQAAGRVADAVERSGLAPESFMTLRRMAEGGSLDRDNVESVADLAGLGLVNDRLEVNDQGRRALRALERGDVRSYLAAVQDAAERQEREARRNKAITLKHGKHDQSSHGRRGARGNASRSAYQAAKASGAGHKDALKAANAVSRSVAVKQRLANIDRQLAGAVNPKQRASLEAEQRRLAGEQSRLASRMTPEQRAAVDGAEVTPTVRGRTAPAKPQPAKADGDTTRAYGADPNTSYQMQHRLVDMANIQASNLPSGAINPNYNPALQPRDRSRAASQAQIDSVARNLNADVLVTDFHRIDAGSPIIDSSGNVLSGNGRTLALQRAAELNPQQYAAYKQRLREEAERLGIDPRAIDGMRNPVLVRELKGDADPVAFAREANSSGTLRMSPLEQAMVDSQQIADRSLLKLNVRDGQGIDQALRDPSNKAFINDFLATVPANERANLLTRNGELNQMGLYRAKAALYSKAFPGEAGNRLAESMLESLDPDVKTIQNGISAGLPNISRATALIRSGDRDGQLDLTEDFAKTIDVYARIKDNPALTANTPANRLVDKYLGQSQMFDRELTPDQEVLLRHIDSISRKPTAVRDMFNRWASLVENQPPPGQTSLFGGGGMTKRELIEALIAGNSGSAQVGMFDG